MKQLFVSTVIIAILLLSGCSSDIRNVDQKTPTIATEQTELLVTDREESDEIQFGYDTESADMDTYVYNGETLAVPFKLEVGKVTGHDVGFLIFIGGVAQQYTVEFADGSISAESSMQRFELSQEGEQKFTFLIQPNVGKQGDKLGIYVCSVIYPSFQPENIEQPSFQYYGSLAQVVPQQVKFEVDSQTNNLHFQGTENELDLTESIMNSIKMFSTKSLEKTLEDSLYVQLYQKSTDEAIMKSTDGEITLHLQLYGGVDGVYNTTVFINHEPVAVNGMDYIQSEMKANKMSECEITLDISDYEYLNTIYAVTVPADEAYLDYFPAEKTSSILIVNDLKQDDSRDNETALPDQLKSIQLNENVLSILKYFEDNDENERMLYINEQSQIVLYDFAAEEKIGTYYFENENRDIIRNKLLSFDENGYVLFLKTAQKQNGDNSVEGLEVYSVNSESEANEICVFDSQLNLVKTYDLAELFPEWDGMYEYYGMCMNADAAELIVYGEDNIYFYSMESGERTPVDKTVMEQLQNISIEEMAISSDGKKIAFLGWELGQDEYQVYGLIELSSGKVNLNHTANSYGNTLNQSQDMVYITDGEVPHKNLASGIIHCINLAEGIISDFQVENLESTAASLSDDQKYMVTAYNKLSKDGKDIVGWQIRAYDFDKDKAIWEDTLDQAGRLVGMKTTGKKVMVMIYREDSGCSIYRYNL